MIWPIPAYAGLTVVENPATSSPGLAFLLATIKHLWRGRLSRLLAASCGKRCARDPMDGRPPITAPLPPHQMVTGPLSSVMPAAHRRRCYFAEEPPQEAPTAAVSAMVAASARSNSWAFLRALNTKHKRSNWSISSWTRTFQEDIPLHMFVFPANETAVLPDVFAQFSADSRSSGSQSPHKTSAPTARSGSKPGQIRYCASKSTSKPGLSNSS